MRIVSPCPALIRKNEFRGLVWSGDYTWFSHHLVQVLRHQGMTWGFNVGPNGYVPLHEPADNLQGFRNPTKRELAWIVATSRKMRFELSCDGEIKLDREGNLIEGDPICHSWLTGALDEDRAPDRLPPSFDGRVLR